MAPINDNGPILANFKRAKVLIVEDNDDYWSLIERALQHKLPEVAAIRATTSSQALSLMNSWSSLEWEIPKLILLDLYLPNRNDGWLVLEQIRHMPIPANQVPIVMLSSSDEQIDITEAYERGSSSYLVKPLDFSEWLSYFEQLRIYWWETVTLPPMRLWA